MERRRRALFAALVAVILVAAVFSAFAMNFFMTDIPEVHLPNVSDQPGQAGESGDGEKDAGVIQVDVTPETVQNIIAATLTRPASYYREVTVELWAGDEDTQSTTTARVWVDNGWTRTDVTGPDGLVRHDLTGDGSHWRWYEGSQQYVSLPAGEASDDLAQHIPTYEDVLDLEQTEIAAAGYEEYGGLACVYVEAERAELNSRMRYWVSVSSGLLVAAERVRGDQVVYRMTALTMESPAPLNSSFALPDGTVLHSMGEDSP